MIHKSDAFAWPRPSQEALNAMRLPTTQDVTVEHADTPLSPSSLVCSLRPEQQPDRFLGPAAPPSAQTSYRGGAGRGHGSAAVPDRAQELTVTGSAGRSTAGWIEG